EDVVDERARPLTGRALDEPLGGVEERHKPVKRAADLGCERLGRDGDLVPDPGEAATLRRTSTIPRLPEQLVDGRAGLAKVVQRAQRRGEARRGACLGGVDELQVQRL